MAMNTLGALMDTLGHAFTVSPAVKPQRSEAMDDNDPYGDIEQCFDNDGRWDEAAAPRVWNDPEAASAQRQFTDILQTCLAELPPRMARVIYLREVLGKSIADICNSLEITESSCSKMLFHARLRLRAGLEARCFAGGCAEH
ncbi:MAG TPA: sigma factor-like helix-turn-helix DNA-binding protein [Burkholderiales bacterium]|nr:sigma factor-like helix-turn-helix DNA-binding protein [Burkholderiales bacterium]